jgi:hypothetical protein
MHAATQGALAVAFAVTKPTFGFPQTLQPWFQALHNGGTSVNGVYAQWPKPTANDRAGPFRLLLTQLAAAAPRLWSRLRHPSASTSC